MRRYILTVDGRRFEIDVDELGAESFRVLLDGNAYEITLESAEELNRPAVTPMVEGFPSQAQAPALLPVATAAPPSPTPRPSAAPVAPPPPATGRGVLSAPMPGTVLSVEVSPGQPVRRGDPLLVLEAMKMQNIIRAPEDALVAEVLVSAGQSVGFGEPMVRFDTGAL
ncbi:MAG: acetyl-CoA carboxylase biotin carboxyl carrier protein subunit [Oscillochloris sp.]|nr:acetyl-CoA carboxylase biotin carboxyl carrier protein subunit [Oscillochloris sp.]